MNHGTLSKISERRVEHFSTDSGLKTFPVIKEVYVAGSLLMACNKEIVSDHELELLAIEELRNYGGLLFYGSSNALDAAREIAMNS